MTGRAGQSGGGEWLGAAEKLYARRRRLTRELIFQTARMGREPAALSAGEGDYLGLHWRRYRETARLLPDRPGGDLLDVGCFPGHLALLARIKGWKVRGISLPGQTWGDPGFENRMRGAGIDIAPVDIQRQPFPFPDRSFDAVFFNETVEHLALNPYQPLDEIWRVLRPDGLLIFSVPNHCRFDLRLAMLRGASTQLSLEGSLEETFPADIANRHIREYTPDEVRYLLERQDKYLYRFQIEKLVMDRSWDGMFCRGDGVVREWRRLTKATLFRDLLTRFVKSLRGNIIVRARRPPRDFSLRLSPGLAGGFYPEEETGTGPGFVRQPIRAAWTRGEAEIEFPPPEVLVRHLDLQMLLPAPATVKSRKVTFSSPAGPWEFLVPVSAEPRRYRVPLNLDSDGEAPFSLRLRTETWRPSDHGISGDHRELGVMISLDRALVSLA